MQKRSLTGQDTSLIKEKVRTNDKIYIKINNVVSRGSLIEDGV